jgi:hypothetical protein
MVGGDTNHGGHVATPTMAEQIHLPFVLIIIMAGIP